MPPATESNFDMACYGLAAYDESIVTRMNQFKSTDPRNRVNYASPEMDAAIDDLTSAATEEEVTDAMADIQEVWNETLPSVLLNAAEYIVAVEDEVHALVASRDSIVMFHDAWVES
jgi:peptide/nickel transport system substrate-binding protein